MTDFLKEFFQTIGDRLKNRVFGPFLIAFLFWNWKPIIMILVSHNPIEDTILDIENNEMFSLSNVFLIPICISLLYSILIPFISFGLGWLIIWPQGKSIQSNYILKGKKRKEDVKIARLDFEYETTKAGKLELQELNMKISNLNQEKENHISEIKSLKSQIDFLKSENIEMGIKNEKEQEARYEKLMSRMSERYSNELVLTNGLLLEEINKELQNGNFDLNGVGESKKNYLLNENLISFIKNHGVELGYTFTDNGRTSYINFLQRTRKELL